MSKRPNPRAERDKALRDALVPLAAAGVTGDQAEAMIYAAFRYVHHGGYDLHDLLSAVFPDNPPARCCIESDITVAYTTNDDGIHLQCEHCDTDVPLDFHPTPADITAATSAHLALRNRR